jgi:hypothetical protein
MVCWKRKLRSYRGGLQSCKPKTQLHDAGLRSEEVTEVNAPTFVLLLTPSPGRDASWQPRGGSHDLNGRYWQGRSLARGEADVATNKLTLSLSWFSRTRACLVAS